MVTGKLYGDSLFKYRTLKAIYGNYSKGHFAQFLNLCFVIALAINYLLRPTAAFSVIILVIVGLAVAGFLVKVQQARIAWSHYERPKTVNDEPDDGKSGVFIVGDEQ